MLTSPALPLNRRSLSVSKQPGTYSTVHASTVQGTFKTDYSDILA